MVSFDMLPFPDVNLRVQPNCCGVYVVCMWCVCGVYVVCMLSICTLSTHRRFRASSSACRYGCAHALPSKCFVCISVMCVRLSGYTSRVIKLARERCVYISVFACARDACACEFMSS